MKHKIKQGPKTLDQDIIILPFPPKVAHQSNQKEKEGKKHRKKGVHILLKGKLGCVVRPHNSWKIEGVS